MSKPTVLLLFNQPLLPRDHPNAVQEHSVVAVAELIVATLNTANFRATRFGVGNDPAPLWRKLSKSRPDVVFNLFEGHLHQPETESYVVGLLEWAGIPYTGSAVPTLSLARAKHTVKHLLRGAGLPTADFQLVHELPVARCTLEFPVFVKPALQDASVGIDHQSVCKNRAEMVRRVKHILATYGAPVLIEEYVAGRELNVSLIELPKLETLPPAEIVFGADKPGTWPIVTYTAKWVAGTSEFDDSPSLIPADVPAAIERKLSRLALDAYRLLDCRDYARVDFRVKPNGEAYILEVNPNPDICAEADLSRCLEATGRTYTDLVVGLVTQALGRRPSL